MQRKAEQKRDMERRRGVRLEEEKRIAQQHRAAEQQRSLDAKHAAQRLVAEQRNLEIVKRNEQQQAEAAAAQHSRDELVSSCVADCSRYANELGKRITVRAVTDWGNPPTERSRCWPTDIPYDQYCRQC